MAVSITFYTFYLAVLGLVATLLSEYTFHAFTRLRLVKARAELEAAIAELRSITRDKRGQRKRSKLAARVNMMYATVKRYTLYRTMLLLGFYTIAVIATLSNQVLIPSRCSIPFITTRLKTAAGPIPVTSSAIVLVLSFLSSIFIVREDVVGLLMLKILQRRPSKE